MNENYLVELETIVSVLRRTIRALRRVIDMVDEDDVQRKFRRFLNEHEQFLSQLDNYVEHDVLRVNTSDASIQFPISIVELFEIVATNEKQVIDTMDAARQLNMPDALSDLLNNRYQKVMKSYDYIQALSEIWV